MSFSEWETTPETGLMKASLTPSDRYSNELLIEPKMTTLMISSFQWSPKAIDNEFSIMFREKRFSFRSNKNFEFNIGVNSERNENYFNSVSSFE